MAYAFLSVPLPALVQMVNPAATVDSAAAKVLNLPCSE